MKGTKYVDIPLERPIPVKHYSYFEDDDDDYYYEKKRWTIHSTKKRRNLNSLDAN